MINLSEEQQTKLAMYGAGITNILLDVFLSGEQPCRPMGMDFEELRSACSNRPVDDFPPEPAPEPIDWRTEEQRRREQDLGRLCGRWKTGGNRHGIEISRRGDHFVLTYLKRNGRPTDERYVIMWMDGDILYYGYNDRLTCLALDTDTDTLMISPGADYTREPEK